VRSWTKPAARTWAALAGLAAWPRGPQGASAGARQSYRA